MRGAGIAVNTPVLTAPVGVHRKLKKDIGRIVGTQGAARCLQMHAGGGGNQPAAMPPMRLAVLGRLGIFRAALCHHRPGHVQCAGVPPPIVSHFAHIATEPVRHAGRRAPPPQGLQRNAHLCRGRREVVGEGVIGMAHNCMNIQFFKQIGCNNPRRCVRTASMARQAITQRPPLAPLQRLRQCPHTPVRDCPVGYSPALSINARYCHGAQAPNRSLFSGC